MASEEWVSENEEKQETQADFERKLQDRYEGTIDQAGQALITTKS